MVKSNCLHCVGNGTGDFSGHSLWSFFFFYLPFLLVFNLHPQKHSKHLLDIERNGIYNADAEQTSLVQFETSFLTCKMLLDTSSFFLFLCFYVFFSLTSGKSLFSRAASLWPRCGMRQLAQYCETGGAVDSMLEVFIVNCLFLYRSKVRVQMTKHLLHICESDVSFQLRLEGQIDLVPLALELLGYFL